MYTLRALRPNAFTICRRCSQYSRGIRVKWSSPAQTGACFKMLPTSPFFGSLDIILSDIFNDYEVSTEPFNGGIFAYLVVFYAFQLASTVSYLVAFSYFYSFSLLIYSILCKIQFFYFLVSSSSSIRVASGMTYYGFYNVSGYLGVQVYAQAANKRMESEQSATKMSMMLLPPSLSLTSSSAVKYLGDCYSSNDSDIINNIKIIGYMF